MPSTAVVKERKEEKRNNVYKITSINIDIAESEVVTNIFDNPNFPFSKPDV